MPANRETITVRSINERDADALFDLAANIPPLTPHSWYTYWNVASNFGGSCFITEADDEPVGFITSHPTTTHPRERFLWQLGLLPEYRGRGFAAWLQDRVVATARDAGAVAIRTTIEADNPRSLKSFERMATRLGTTLEEKGRFTPRGSEVPEVLYRMSIDR